MSCLFRVLECVVFFFGTARRIDSQMSWREGMRSGSNDSTADCGYANRRIELGGGRLVTGRILGRDRASWRRGRGSLHRSQRLGCSEDMSATTAMAAMAAESAPPGS